VHSAIAWIRDPVNAKKLPADPSYIVIIGLAPSNNTILEALHKAGDQAVTAIHLATGHSYSDQRIAVEKQCSTP
jgi:hypothetical protein